MTVYAKIENGQLITAYNGYNGITGFADNIEIMTANGFNPYDEEIISKYFAGMAIIQKGKLIDITDTDDYKAEQAEKERMRIANLTMTALDFIGVLKQVGLTTQQIKEYLDNNIELDMQLKYCQNVYCGVVYQLCPLTIGDVTITQDMVIQIFKQKNGEV